MILIHSYQSWSNSMTAITDSEKTVNAQMNKI